MDKLDVLIVGSVNTDHVVRVAALPNAGETVTGGSFESHGGGKGANQAVAAARLGANVGLIAAVGNDDAGARAINELQSEGVDVAHVSRLSGVATGVALIVVDDEGENQIAVASGANSSLSAEHVASALEQVELDQNGVLLLGFEVADSAVEAAARWAVNRGCTVVLDPAPARRVSPVVMACSPIIKPNAGEAALLTGERDPAIAGGQLSDLSGNSVVVTLGGDGALIIGGGDVIAMAPHMATPIDTTGAGDTFSGALATGLAHGLELVAAVHRAQVAAAMSTEHQGARSGMPQSDELDRILETTP